MKGERKIQGRGNNTARQPEDRERDDAYTGKGKGRGKGAEMRMVYRLKGGIGTDPCRETEIHGERET